jgi:hypothetical protein
MIVSIGVDCGVGDFCKKYGLRTISLPFDWVVSYHGVSACIDDEFKEFIPKEGMINKYDIYFNHDFNGEKDEEDTLKYLRRAKRFMDILTESKEEIIFFRRGHAQHHHREHQGRYETIKNDIQDAEDLDRILSSKYPNLKYRIIVVLVCGRCFSREKIYSSLPRVEVHNIVTPEVDFFMFENLAKKILLPSS